MTLLPPCPQLPPTLPMSSESSGHCHTEEAEDEPPSHIVRLRSETPLWKEDRLEQVRRAACAALDFVAPRGQTSDAPPLIVSILCTNERRMRTLNRLFRDKDTPCDSLAFPALDPHDKQVCSSQEHDGHKHEDSMCGFLGDLALGYQGLQRTIEQHRLDALAHCAHMTVHGVLHLAGFTHDKTLTRTAMEAAEGTILTRLGFADLHPLALA